MAAIWGRFGARLRQCWIRFGDGFERLFDAYFNIVKTVIIDLASETARDSGRLRADMKSVTPVGLSPKINFYFRLARRNSFPPRPFLLAGKPAG